MYLGEKLPYVEDPFDLRRQKEKKELEEHHKKLQEKPFSNRVKGREFFFDDKIQYGENPKIPARPPKDARKPLMTHDFPFYPSNPSKK